MRRLGVCVERMPSHLRTLGLSLEKIAELVQAKDLAMRIEGKAIIGEFLISGVVVFPIS